MRFQNRANVSFLEDVVSGSFTGVTSLRNSRFFLPEFQQNFKII